MPGRVGRMCAGRTRDASFRSVSMGVVRRVFYIVAGWVFHIPSSMIRDLTKMTGRILLDTNASVYYSMFSDLPLCAGRGCIYIPCKYYIIIHAILRH